MPDENKRLDDGRKHLGSDFERAQSPADRELARSFVESEYGETEMVGGQFADPEMVERRKLGQSFADPNSLDDAKLGHAFEESNSPHRRKTRHPEPPRPNRKPINRRILFFCIAAALLLLLLVFLVGFLPRHRRTREINERADQQRDALPTVEVETVRRSSGNSGLVVPGTTTPLVEAFVYARSNGYLQRRLVDIGDHVRRGQLLAVIDSPDLDQQVDQAREQLRQAEAQRSQQETQLALARVTVERFRVLVSKGVFSRQEGDQREADFRAQLANVSAAERNVEAFRANLRRVLALQSYERVTAPFAGVVTARNVDVGALISAAGSAGGNTGPAPASQGAGLTQTAVSNSGGVSGLPSTAATSGNAGSQGGPLFSIAQVGTLRVLVSVPEGYAHSVRAGQAAALHFQELPQTDFTGKVTRTSAAIDQNTRTLLTEVQVDNRAGQLMTGMYAVVTFAGLSGKGPLTVTGDAIAIRQDQPVVALVRDGKVKLQRVEIGRDFGPVVEIIRGLNEGDTVAASITDDIREGASVTVQQGKAAEQAQTPQPVSQSSQGTGGSTRYGNPAVVDQNMQGQAGKQGGSPSKGASGSGSKP